MRYRDAMAEAMAELARWDARHRDAVRRSSRNRVPTTPPLPCACGAPAWNRTRSCSACYFRHYRARRAAIGRPVLNKPHHLRPCYRVRRGSPHNKGGSTSSATCAETRTPAYAPPNVTAL